MPALFNWRHLPIVIGVLALAVMIAADRMFIPPYLIVVPALMGLAVGALARTLGSGAATFFFLIFSGTLCWLNPVFLDALPTVLVGMLLGTLLGRGLVAVPVVAAAPIAVAPGYQQPMQHQPLI